MTSHIPDDRALLELYRAGLEMKRQGTDISKPNIAKMLLGIIPQENRQPFRMMVVLLRMEPSIESPEWAAMTADERSQTLAKAIVSMPEGFWDDGGEGDQS